MYLVKETTKNIWSLINSKSNTTIVYWSADKVQVSVNETNGLVNVSLADDVILFTGIVPVIWVRQ
jgi:hypothetical protein